MSARVSMIPQRWSVLLMAFFGAWASADAPAEAPAPQYGAAMNYQLHCEGCHKADGSGQPGYIPALRDNVARFLAVPTGRAYLARVPGTSQSLLNDRERAEVLNWIVKTFDPQHLRADFAPYTEAELAHWRTDPISQASVERARVLALIGAPATTETKPR